MSAWLVVGPVYVAVTVPVVVLPPTEAVAIVACCCAVRLSSMAFCWLSSLVIDDFCAAYCAVSCWTPVSVRCRCCFIVESSLAEVSSCCASWLWVPSICSTSDAWLSTASGLPEVSRPMTDVSPEFS